MKNLKDKVVLIAGGATGIGSAIVSRFVEEGAKVVMADVAEETGRETASAVGALFIKADVTDPTAVESAVKQAVEYGGRLDIMVNCAAIQPEQKPLDQANLDYWDKVVEVTLKGTMHGMKYSLVQFLKQEGGGSIVNISSTAGSVALVGTGGYGASKAAVGNLTRLTAVEYGKHGIRVNAVMPSVVMTKLTRTYIENSEDPKATLEYLKGMDPLVGMAKPEDVAAAVAFLASDDARFISGAILPVDGAFTCTAT